ncbi:MAG: hypothetical protein J1G05_05345 [Clostridiales bacterium]|nr:hypothetical protein [Clostridiales bacterium]
MDELNAEKIKKLKRGEAVGTAATVVCCVISAAFIVCFAIAQTKDIYILRMISIILLPILLLLAIGVSAYCNLKFGKEINSIIKSRVKAVLIENASLMHPDRSVLSFGISVGENDAEIKVGNFKESIKFDFSAFGKLSPMKKSAVAEAIAERLNITFCRMHERGVHYNSVSYFRANTDKKNGKVIYIIENGLPDKRAYRNYKKAD